MTPSELKYACDLERSIHGDRARLLARVPGPAHFNTELWPGGPYGNPVPGEPETDDGVLVAFNPKIVLQFLALNRDNDQVAWHLRSATLEQRGRNHVNSVSNP
jgi:hypothetical protein